MPSTSRAWLAALLLWAAHAPAQETLTPERIGELQAEEQDAVDAVTRAHGNRKPSEMSPEERRAVIREQAEASARVLRERGVDAKTLARAAATLDREGRVRATLAQGAWRERRAREALEQAAAAAKDAESVPVRHGFNNADPIEEDVPAAPSDE